MIEELFKNAIECLKRKQHIFRNNNTMDVFQTYEAIYTEFFCNSLRRIFPNDLGNSNIGSPSGLSAQYHYHNLQLPDNSLNYLIKLCNIILNENYNIGIETDKTIVKYYYLFYFIPIYFEIIHGCYHIYDINKRTQISNEFNNPFTFQNQNLRIVPNARSMFNVHLSEIMYNSISELNLNKYITFINKYSADFIQRQQTAVTITMPTTMPPPVPTTNPARIITNNDIYKTVSYKKDDLIKVAMAKNIIGCYKLTISELEESLIKIIEGNTLKEKALVLNLRFNLDVNEHSIKNAILLLLTGKLK